ncbi:hypothetical protein PENTCL1PPCAC_4463, partial [Pristionchus entomophagus]
FQISPTRNRLRAHPHHVAALSALPYSSYRTQHPTTVFISMDPALLSYLTTQQMLGQQFGFPLLQTGAVPMTVQAPSLLQPAASTQLISIDQYFKPATIPTTASPDLLLQLLNNNSFGAVSMAPQVPVSAPPVMMKQQPLPTPQASFLSLFEQLVAAQQATTMQHTPLFVDHASSFAALSVQQQQQRLSVSSAPPLNFGALINQPTTVLPPTTTVHAQPTVLRPQANVLGTSRLAPVITIESPETTPPRSAFRPASAFAAAAVAAADRHPAVAAAMATPTPKAAAAVCPPTPHPTPVKQEVCSPVKSSHSEPTRSWLTPEAAAVASTSKSSSVDEEAESIMSGEEEERCRPEDVFAGRQRRADHIAFHRKMKSLLKSLRGADLVCKLCSVKVDRHDNAFKTHIAEHAEHGANQLECRYCGYETPSRVEMNIHMGERHPNGSERAYTDKRDHLKMIEIMYECFSKAPRLYKTQTAKKDPALVKPRMTRKRRLAADDAAAAATSAAPAADAAEETTTTAEPFEMTIVRFCTESVSKEVECACGDEVPLNPSALLSHVKTLHARYRCSDCGDVLDSPDAARTHTTRMHGGDARTFAARLVDHLIVRDMQQRFMTCFIRKEPGLGKTHSVKVLQNEMDEELEKEVRKEKEIKKEIKEEPADA